MPIDLDGALLRSRPFDEAHRQWFSLMSVLLHDDSVNGFAGAEDYFTKVNAVMARYLGNVDSAARTRFARELYAMITVACVAKEDLVKEFADYLTIVKQKYRLALITTAPKSAVAPILEKVGCSTLFDIILKSDTSQEPSKKEQFTSFIERYGTPAFYIGNGDKDIVSCKEMGIPSISVNWVSQGKVKGDYDVKTVAELKSILA